MKSSFSFSTAKAEKNSWKKLGKTRLVVLWFDVTKKDFISNFFKRSHQTPAHYWDYFWAICVDVTNTIWKLDFDQWYIHTYHLIKYIILLQVRHWEWFFFLNKYFFFFHLKGTTWLCWTPTNGDRSPPCRGNPRCRGNSRIQSPGGSKRTPSGWTCGEMWILCLLLQKEERNVYSLYSYALAMHCLQNGKIFLFVYFFFGEHFDKKMNEYRSQLDA